jgi:tetratricopeptide (TPR) repeat protein
MHEQAAHYEREEPGQSAWVLNNLAQLVSINLEMLNRTEEGAADLKRFREFYDSLSTPDSSWDAWIVATEARIKAERGQVDEAKQILRNGLEKGGSWSVIRPYKYILGYLYRKSGEPDSAVACWQEMVESNPGVDTYLYLGASLIEAGQFAEAVTQIEHALSLHVQILDAPDESVLCHYYLGQAYEGNGQVRDAIEQYETFLDIWKNADEGLEAVEDARARLQRLTT